MANIKRNVSTAWAITIIVVLAAVIGTYVYVASKKGWDVMNVTENLGMLNDYNDSGDPGRTPSQPNNPGGGTGTGIRSIFEDGFSVTYAASLANEVKLVDSLPDNRTAQFSATALVPASRIAQLGERKCNYGQSGELTECRIEMEPKISFFTAAKSVNELTAEYDATLLTAVTVAGVKSVLYSIGAEGEGIDVYFIPVDNNRTAIVKRLYRQGGFPTKAQVEQILATVKINN